MRTENVPRNFGTIFWAIVAVHAPRIIFVQRTRPAHVHCASRSPVNAERGQLTPTLISTDALDDAREEGDGLGKLK